MSVIRDNLRICLEERGDLKNEISFMHVIINKNKILHYFGELLHENRYFEISNLHQLKYFYVSTNPFKSSNDTDLNN